MEYTYYKIFTNLTNGEEFNFIIVGTNEESVKEIVLMQENIREVTNIRLATDEEIENNQ